MDVAPVWPHQLDSSASGAFKVQFAASSGGTVTVKRGSTLSYLYTNVV